MAEVTENINQKDILPKSKAKEFKSGIWFSVLILVIVFALAGAGYLLFQQVRDEEQDLASELGKDTQQRLELTKQISGYQDQLVAIQKHLSDLSSEVGSKESNFEAKLNELSTLHTERLKNSSERINESILRIQRQLGKTRGDWLVADAEYLLSVANRRLHLMGDVDTTVEALKAADQRLRESGDTAAFKVRGQIAKEIAAVKKVQLADVVGIYSTLEMLEEDVAKLKVFLPYAGKGLSSGDVETQAKPLSENDINAKLDDALVAIEGIVTIRRLDKPVTSVITPEQKAFITEQLSTKLEIVKLALVQQDDTLYQASINDVLQWLKSHFTKNEDYKQFTLELERLKTIQIRRHFPDISGSLKMLRDITKLRLETDKALQVTDVQAE